jgi:Secretion system C-terminal sorting domain
MNAMHWNKQNSCGILLFLLLVWSVPVWTQPDWTVTPEDYEFTMTVTGFAQIACTESHDPQNMVAAFIEGEVRGVQYFSDEVNGHQLAFMIVYDNVFSGNAVTFKMYDASQDTIIDVLGSVEFRESTSRGNSNNPYRFITAPGIAEIHLTEDQIPAELRTNDPVTTFTAFNADGEAAEADFTFIYDSLGLDNHYFTLDGNQLLLNVDAFSIDDEVMDLHILATPSDGCPLAHAFQLTFSGTTSIESDIEKNDLVIYPNPTQGIVHWNTDISFDYLSVYDLHGRMILQKAVHNLGNVNLSELGAGVYVLNLLGEESRSARVMIGE